MKQTRLLFAVVMAVMLSACSKEQHDLFADSSANRADDAIIADIQVLTGAPYGWLMHYYPDSQQSYGGYNLLLRFQNDGLTAVMGEVYGDTIFVSHYSVTQSAGIVLTFDTYNPEFHAFSDPSAPFGGSSGTGLNGDYDFSVLQATPDSVVLKGKKTGNHILMTPLADSHWAGYLSTIAQVDSAMTSSSYVLRLGSDELAVQRYARTLIVSYEDQDENHEVTLPYIITPQGMLLYRPVTLKGYTFSGFRYMEDSLTFPADAPGVSLVIANAPSA